jgi:hypothetical protein
MGAKKAGRMGVAVGTWDLIGSSTWLNLGWEFDVDGDARGGPIHCHCYDTRSIKWQSSFDVRLFSSEDSEKIILKKKPAGGRAFPSVSFLQKCSMISTMK